VTRAAAAVLLAVLLVGCGSSKDARRSNVNDYIAGVNTVEREAAVPWNRARRAYLDLARGTVTDRQLRVLAAAPATIRSLRARVAAMKPPEDAKHLHIAVLRLLDLNARFAGEVSAFARYVRAVGPIEKQLAAATSQLRLALSRSRVSSVQQQKLTAYAARVGRLVADARGLHPPPALAPWHAGQIARMTTLRNGARTVRDGLARGDATLARRGLTALTGGAAASPVTVADRRAVLAYDGRLKRIRIAAAAVAREQTKLARALT